MSNRLATLPYQDVQRSRGPLYRSIVAIDLEGSTTRTDLVKGVLRRAMYDLLGRALDAVSVTDSHLEQPADRGDGVLLLIRPHDDVPKTALLDQLIPLLADLLTEHNAGVAQPALQMRLRAVMHAGEVYADDNGFFGEAIDIAIRLLDSVSLKRALKEAESPLVLVVSEEIYSGIIAHGCVRGGYWPAVRVLVAGKQHRGWVHVPVLNKHNSVSGTANWTRPCLSGRMPFFTGAQKEAHDDQATRRRGPGREAGSTDRNPPRRRRTAVGRPAGLRGQAV